MQRLFHHTRSFIAVILLGVGSLPVVNGAIVTYSDYAAFQAAAAGVQSIINFESFAAGDAVTTVGDVTFSEGFGSTLEIFNTFPTDTISPSNYVGNGDAFIGEQFTEDEEVSIAFDAGAERSAVGVWVQYDPINLLNQGVLGLEDDFSGIQSLVVEGDGMLLDTDTAFFIGLVDDTGLNSIGSVTLLETSFDTVRYTFDNVVSYRVTAVPEPGTALALTLFGAGWIVRRSRKPNQTKKSA